LTLARKSIAAETVLPISAAGDERAS